MNIKPVNEHTNCLGCFDMPMFRRFIRSCMRKKIRLKVCDYYNNSLGHHIEHNYQGKITGYQVISNEYSERVIKIKMGRKSFTVDIPADAEINYDNKRFSIKWLDSGPYCGVIFYVNDIWSRWFKG